MSEKPFEQKYESGEVPQFGDIVTIDSVASAESRGLIAGEEYRLIEFNRIGNLVVVPMNGGGDSFGHGSLRFRLVRRESPLASTTGELRAAAAALLAACEEEFEGDEDMSEFPDDTPVSGGEGGDSPITFGMIRQLRFALSNHTKRESR